MSWPWIVLLAIGVGVVVAAEWPRFERLAGADARRLREREKRKAKLTVISTDDDEFVRSVQADLEALPTIEERETPRESSGRPRASGSRSRPGSTRVLGRIGGTFSMLRDSW